MCRYREESPTHGAFSSLLLHTPTHCIFQCTLEEAVSVAHVIDSDSAERLLLACPFCSFLPSSFQYPPLSVFRSQEAGAPTPSPLQLGILCPWISRKNNAFLCVWPDHHRINHFHNFPSSVPQKEISRSIVSVFPFSEASKIHQSKYIVAQLIVRSLLHNGKRGDFIQCSILHSTKWTLERTQKFTLPHHMPTYWLLFDVLTAFGTVLSAVKIIIHSSPMTDVAGSCR